MTPRVSLILLAGVAAVVGLGFLIGRPAPPPAPPSSAPSADDLSQAEAQAREAFARAPNDGPAALRLARILRLRGNYPEAQLALGQAGRLGVPENDGRKEAVLLLTTGDWPPQVEGMFQRVVRDNPTDAEVLLAVGKAYATKGRTVEAEKVLSQLVALDPNRLEWRYARGEARMKAGDYEAAIQDLRPVVQAEPANYSARLFLANSLLGDAQMAEAETHLIVCRDVHPAAADPLIGLGKCAIEKNDLDKAENLLQRASQLEPFSVFALQELASLALLRQRTADAIAVLDRIVTLDPDNRTAHFQLAQSLLAVGRRDDSRKHELRYQELDRREEERLLIRRGGMR
ncbi:tetratricopeptide repeat protein [Limnoglobus roseus]|uniref:Uncharacterized protein n=1 Tax=Limnoglobus roseus TaxID=2598579 RepID=A0A5C1A8N6_9BACT|nr:tetratricopeptide repeat protein [Limnoglobus roseus]QEL13514.1 hypothetical protein PX52LOC_00372 [Limnoglobus roseus]